MQVPPADSTQRPARSCWTQQRGSAFQVSKFLRRLCTFGLVWRTVASSLCCIQHSARVSARHGLLNRPPRKVARLETASTPRQDHLHFESVNHSVHVSVKDRYRRRRRALWSVWLRFFCCARRVGCAKRRASPPSGVAVGYSPWAAPDNDARGTSYLRRWGRALRNDGLQSDGKHAAGRELARVLGLGCPPRPAGHLSAERRPRG